MRVFSFSSPLVHQGRRAFFLSSRDPIRFFCSRCINRRRLPRFSCFFRKIGFRNDLFRLLCFNWCVGSVRSLFAWLGIFGWTYRICSYHLSIKFLFLVISIADRCCHFFHSMSWSRALLIADVCFNSDFLVLCVTRTL